MRLVTQKDILEINRLYAQYKTYAAVARETGFSPATVKKYIKAGYKPVDESAFKRFNRPLPDFDPTIFRIEDWGTLCVLSDDEIDEIEELWEELEV